MAFRLINFKAGQVLDEIQGGASTQFYPGQALVLTNGILVANTSQTGKPSHIYNAMIPAKSVMRPATDNLTTTVGEKLLAIPCAGNEQEFETDLVAISTDTDMVPPINGVAANTNATATSVLATTATSDNDYDGGTLYCVELDEHRPITDSQDTGGVCTFTVAPGFSRAVTLGDHIRAVPVGIGASPKFTSANPSRAVSMLVADKTGGNILVTQVDLKNYKLRLKFKDV